MNRGFLNIITLAIVCIAGCQDSGDRKTQALMEGITLTDLEPITSRSLGEKILFQILTFEVPAGKTAMLNSALVELGERPLKFVDHSSFKADGFSAACGSDRMFDKATRRVYSTGAKKTKTNTLMIFDDKDYDVPVRKINKEQIAPYIDSDAAISEQSFRAGKLVWRINARKVAGLKDTVEIDVRPAFKRDITSTVMILAGKKEVSEAVFDSAGFKFRMGEGDFIFIWPDKRAENKNTLGNLFFSSHGDFIVRRDGSMPSVELRHDVALIRFYLIICGGIQQ